MAPASHLRSRLQATVASGVTFCLWLWRGNQIAATLAIIAAILALIAWIFPRHYRPISRFFDRIAHGVLVAFTWFVLGLVYFGLFAPIRLWRDLRGHDPLMLRRNHTAKTYFTALNSSAETRFDRMF